MQLRRAKPNDASVLAEVVRAAYAPFRDAGLDLPPVDEGLDRAIAETPVWVAVDADGACIGGIVLRLMDDAVKIENLAVHPRAAGAGIGRQLLQKAETVARAQGARLMMLATHADMTSTIGFYRRNGWIETGREGTRLFMEKPVSAV